MIGYSKLDQVGKPKKTQATKNADANKKLDQIYKKKNLYDICEVRLAKDCLKVAKTSSVGTELKMTYAHRHKRQWYKVGSRYPLLYSFNETVRACIPCHMMIEHDRKLTNKVFIKLRGTALSRKVK